MIPPPHGAGRVVALYRFPVKSLAGEQVAALDVDVRGVVGDRWWSVGDQDGRFGSTKTTRRFRRMDGLLEIGAEYDEDVPVLTFPDGTVVRGDDPRVHAALSAYVGRPVRLAPEGSVSHFDEGPLHLVATASLDRLADARGAVIDARRPRANIVVATDDLEDDWTGRVLRIGSVEVQVLSPMPRCVMLDRGQRGLAPDPGLLAAATRAAAGELGVVADVVTPGRVRLGDDVRMLDAP